MSDHRLYNLKTLVLYRLKTLVFAGLSACLALAVSGCGDQKFRSVPSTVAGKAPGSVLIPPKVDILLAIDDSGSMRRLADAVSVQLPIFLNEIEAKNWDYRFAITQLQNPGDLTQIVGSKYDPNWNQDAFGRQWNPPFPGADPSLIPAIDPAYFRTINSFGQWPQWSSASGDEPGLQTIYDTLALTAPSRGFIRQDALLVVIHIGNGQDLSKPGPTIYDRGDGILIPRPPETWDDGLAGESGWYKMLRSLKPDPKQFRFFSWSNPSGLFASSRYRNVALNLASTGSYGSPNFDIYTDPLSTVTAAMTQQLETQRVQFQTRYLFISKAPNTSTIKVKKYPGGNASAGIDIPNSSVNGWTYAGYKAPPGVYAIDFPILMNRTAGYAIELHGTAKLVGTDSADISFKPAGFIN